MGLADSQVLRTSFYRQWNAQPAGITVAKSSGDDKWTESLMEHHGAGTRATAGGEVETNKLLASGTGCTV
jgi:hypothetical protein